LEFDLAMGKLPGSEVAREVVSDAQGIAGSAEGDPTRLAVPPMGLVPDDGGSVGVDPDGSAGVLPFADEGGGGFGDGKGVGDAIGAAGEAGAGALRGEAWTGRV
jgi:hypothetical protein